ncbi:alpha-ribazole phosphatase [bacterium]|nr:alpha-ribazole phosphatase [bacterium]
MIPADVTRIVLLRHGEVHPEDARGLYGQMDVRLSERGIRQSDAAGAWLANQRFARVYTSDLRRAHYLGSSIARHQGLAPTVTPALRERNFGAWQALTWQEIQDRFPDEHRRYEANRFTMRVPGGAENFQDVRHRVIGFLHSILDRHRGQQIAITAHSGPNRLILAEALRLPLESLFTFEQDYCCRNVIDFPASGTPRVRLLNGTEHLGGI